MSRSRVHARVRRPLPLLAVLAATAAALFAPAAAQAAAPLSWSAPLALGSDPTAISCPSEGLCVAVDGGNVFHSGDPTAPAPAFAEANGVAPSELKAVSCPSAGLCVAVDSSGEALSSTNPTGGTGSWHAAKIDGSTILTGVSCPSSTLCVAVDADGRQLASTNPAGGAGSWHTQDIDGTSDLHGVSCASESLCVTADSDGNVFSSTDPGAASPTWTGRAIDPGAEPAVAVSCSPPGGPCVVLDNAGNALASANPGSSSPTWSDTPIGLSGLLGVSCAASGLCVAVDASGQALASDAPTAATPQWSGSTVQGGAAVNGISCLQSGVCFAVDRSGGTGHFVKALVPAPLTSTTAASEVSATEATLTAAVNPNDAVLGGCRFEYGPTSTYGESAECATLPTPAGGVQTVQAKVTGLAATSTYHYRVVAANAAGTSFGADATVTTPEAITVVHPHPAIAGVPGVGSRLRCESGVASSSSVTLTYAWIRDSSAIAGATTSSYVVASADAKQHLQCQVTATDAAGSATAGSAFVAIPASGVLASAGETKVGRVTVLNGYLVSVPLTCSAQAPAGCTVALRLTTQTLSGKPARRHTVTLAALAAHLKRGEKRTLRFAPTSSGKRLLAKAHRLGARLTVSGTVIGVLKANLASATLTLRATVGRVH